MLGAVLQQITKAGWSGIQGVILAMLVLTIGSVYAQNAQKLLICLPGNAHLRELQSHYEETLGLGNAVSFGRIRDLENMLAVSPDAVIIVPGPFVDYSPGFKPVLQGNRKGETSVRWVLLSSASGITTDSLPLLKAGIVDILGREKLSLFVKSMFGVEPYQIKRATTLEDLVILLGMESVDALIIPASDISYVKSRTRIPVKQIMQSWRTVGLPVVAAQNPTGARIEKLLKVLIKDDPEYLLFLGIDKWEH